MRSGRITLPLAPTGEIDRRGFCQLAAACFAGLALGGCGGDSDVIHTGPLDQPDGGGGDDDPRPDGAMMIDARLPPDASAVGTCTGSGQVDVGGPGTFAINTATLFLAQRLFIVRDSGGLYAVSSQCTHHSSATLDVSSGRFHCPRHGALFTFNGDVISGPVIFGLVHYSLCLLDNGHVGVATSSTVPQSTRLDA